MIVILWIVLYLMLGYLTVFLVSLSAPPPDEIAEIIAIIAWPIMAMVALVIVAYAFFDNYVVGSVIFPSKAAQKVTDRHRMLTIESNDRDLRDT